jgi:hypothetical protein
MAAAADGKSEKSISYDLNGRSGGKSRRSHWKEIGAMTECSLKNSMRAEVNAVKNVTQASNAFNKVTNGGQNMYGAKAMQASTKLNGSKATAQAARASTVGAKAVNTVTKGAVGSTVNKGATNSVVDKVKS